MMKTPISPKISLKRLRHVAAQQFDIRIASDGRWFHEDDEIRRIELVKLFASILVLDDKGDHWLATPVEKGRITVDDAPFVVGEMTIKTGTQSQQNKICFQTNIDETVLLDTQHPLQLRASPQSPDLCPYIEVRDGLLAKLSRPVYYQLANYAEVGPSGRLGIWSYNQFFALEA